MSVKTKKLAAAAVTAAAYAALTVLLAPVSYGAAQFRVSEALCVLPAVLPCAVWGLTAGCAAANLLSAAGPLDVIFGSLATLGAALCAAAIGRGGRRDGERGLGWGRTVAVCLMPAAWNGPMIGAVLAWVSAPAEAFWGAFALMGAQVAAGELGVLLLVGLPLLRLLLRNGTFTEIVDKIDG